MGALRGIPERGTARREQVGVEISDLLNRREGLGSILYRNVHFPLAGEEVVLVLENPYTETQKVPNGKYRSYVVQGSRRANIRRGHSDWTWEVVYFISDVSDVYADILIDF